MKKRLISAIVMIFVSIPLIILGNLPFNILILVLGELCLYEILQFRKRLSIGLKVLAHLFTGVLIFNSYIGIEAEAILMLLLLIFLLLLVFLNDKKYNYKEVFFLIGLITFIGLAFSKFIYIRNIGLYYFIYLILITIGTDTFALFIGKSIGKHKLAPHISPNKTIEGMLGGTIVGTLVSVIFYMILIKDLPLVYLIMQSLFLSLVGQMGDLAASKIKRYENVKDFSNLIPGHGGVVDRLDSIIFVVITYVLIYNLI